MTGLSGLSSEQLSVEVTGYLHDAPVVIHSVGPLSRAVAIAWAAEFNQARSSGDPLAVLRPVTRLSAVSSTV